MGFYFEFAQADTEREIARAVDFLAKQPLGYPHYDKWVQRAEAELLSGYKRTIIALSARQIVGDLVYQRHKTIPQTIELKNMRVDERLRRRDFARFMLKQVEIEARNSGALALVADLRPERKEALAFLISSGFFPISRLCLYDSAEEDIVIMKPLLEDSRLIRAVSAHFG